MGLILNMVKQSCIPLAFEHMVLKEFAEILNSYKFSVSQTSLKILKLLWRWVKSLSLRFWQQFFLDFSFAGKSKTSWKSWQLYLLRFLFLSFVTQKKKRKIRKPLVWLCSKNGTRFESLLFCAFICYANVSSFSPLFFHFSFRWVTIYRLSEFLRKLSCHFDDENHETAMRILCFVRT